MSIDIGNKFIHAEKTDHIISGKPVFSIVNNHSGDEIAEVCWYATWKRYVVSVNDSTVFDVGCLKSIIAFIEKQPKD